MKGVKLLLLLLFCGSVFAQEVVLTKAITVKFRKLEEVASLINPMLSEKGAVTLQPKMRTVVIQDYHKNLRSIEMAVAKFDTPPAAFELSVKLVQATKGNGAANGPSQTEDWEKVGQVLRFDHFSVLDSELVHSVMGQPSNVLLAKDYQLQFVADVIPEGNGIVRLKNFRLNKKKKDAAGKEIFAPLLSMTLNLRDQETLVLGASRFEDSDRALLVILLAKVKK
ncbi:MAG TPA: hypothetical protein VJ521_04425 [Acidobacteriota bacterium]|nr:hypothetical protein [Acidobacteriota bacterium]